MSTLKRSRPGVRKLAFALSMLLSQVAVIASAKTGATTSSLAFDNSRGGGIYGPTIAVDPAFDYYKKHPLPEICADIRKHGFTAAQIIWTKEPPPGEQRRIADAFRAAGVAPILRVYPPTDFDLYAEHPEWRQKMIGAPDGKFDWRAYLCPNREDFVSTYTARVARWMREGNYDGIQLAEIWFEQWGGPLDKGKPRAHYACVCDACVAKFKKIAGVDARDLLTSTSSPWYFQKPENAALYSRWVDFRVETIQEFARGIIEAVKREKPDAAINIAYMGDARVKLDGNTEYQGNDLNRMVSELKPDILTIEDAWQDWTRPKLEPGFVADYAKAYRDRIERLHPGTFVMSHADIGSLPASKRSFEWIKKFSLATVKSGLGAPSFYEWSVSTMAAPAGLSSTK